MHRARLPAEVTLDDAERAIHGVMRAAAATESIELDLSAVRKLYPGAASRIGNCLRAVANQSRIVVLVPPSKDGQRVLTTSGIGEQLAEHATTIGIPGAARTKELRAALAERPPLPPTTFLDWNLSESRNFVSRSRSDIRELLQNWLAEFPSQRRRGRLPQGAELAAIAEVVAEAAANVQDHSGRKPLDPSQVVSSYVCFRWRSSTELKVMNIDRAGVDRLSIYLESIARWQNELGGLSGFLEIEIVDDGVGIACRQALDPTLTSNPDMQPERDALAQALTAGQSVKLRSLDCPVDKEPGFGSAIVAAVLHRMGGFATIRSGRLLAYLDAGSGDETDFKLEAAALGLVPGCIVGILIPVFERPRPAAVPPEPQTRLF